MDGVRIAELPSQQFRPRVYGVGAWTDNLHLGYDLVATLRPKVLVELGTDRGESYFAFCQAVAENGTGTRCFTVDTWQGDQQAGGYDETTWREVSQHNAKHYAGFSTLLRCSFDEEIERFEADTIDLLHLDGLHTEGAVRRDLESWLPKIRPGGILLMHDVCVRRHGFGVWKVWEELRASGRSFVFSAGPGLGVWQKPPADRLPDPVESLLGDRPASAALDAYYRGRASATQQKIAQHWRDGTIRKTAAAQQTIIQVFHTHDGIHREEDSILARVGHEAWKEVSLALPSGAGAAPLRIDFVSPFTTIDVALIQVTAAQEMIFTAETRTAFDAIRVRGDAERKSHHRYLRIKITGVDPQLYLPEVDLPRDVPDLRAALRLRVSIEEPPAT